jgi:hypothetical protein
MKSNIRHLAFILLFAATSIPVTSHAQTRLTQARIDVPFAFDYGSAHFSPGAYILDMQNPNIMQLHGRSHSALAMTATESNHHAKMLKTGQVVFEKYGDRYFLQEVEVANSTTHLSVYQTKWQKRAARELAAQATVPSRVELAMVTTPSTVSGN